jgi:FkbM family methyltransferase
MSINKVVKKKLEQYGWYLRRLSGINCGTNVWTELWRDYGDCVKCMIDVGAHRGETIDQVHEMFPDCLIHAFEPVKSNFEVLNERYYGVPKVTLYHTALGATEGDVEILLQQDSQTHSLRHLAQQVHDGQTERVRVLTLNLWRTTVECSKIDLLKIDTEGFEMEVLRGGESWLKSKEVTWILCEATLDPEDTSHTQLSVLTAYLFEFGYRLAGLYDQTQWQQPCRLAYFNALFKRAD